MVKKFLDNKLLIIRADAFKEIGSGHVMRCMALAQTWLSYNGRIAFISHCESESIRNQIIAEGIKLIPIYKPAYDQNEINNIINISNKSVPKSKKETWFVLDGYSFDQDYQKAIMNAGYKLIVIDDMNHNSFYHTNILLNQNLHADGLGYKTGNDTVKLLGPKYALLRKEFCQWRNWKTHNPPIASKILITLGGSDNKNLTGTVLNALKKVKINNIQVSVVIGPTNKNISKIKKELIAAKYKHELIKSPSDISMLMSWADIAISAGGSTSWEMAFMGLPSVAIVLSEDQKEIVDELDNKKASLNLGWYEDLNQNKIVSAIEEIMLNQKARNVQTKVKKKLVDGLGSQRVIKTMIEYSEQLNN